MKSLVELVKEGDTLTVQGDGYLRNHVYKVKVLRKTKTKIVVLNGKSEFKVAEDGVIMPRDKVINYRVIKINGEDW